METNIKQETYSLEAHPNVAEQLYSEFSLQTVVDDIKKATQADVIIFYLYDRVRERFDLPPHVSGMLFDPDTHQGMHPVQPRMLSRLAVYREPIFATSSESLYYLLHDDATP